MCDIMYCICRAISFMIETMDRQQDCDTHPSMTLRNDCMLSPATGVQTILSDFKVYEQMSELERSNIFKQRGFELNNRRKLNLPLLPQRLVLYLNLLKSLLVTWCTNSLTFNNCTLCPHCIYVFCIYLRTNSDLCHLQHKLIGFYNRDEKCLLRGTDWGFK